MDQVHLSEGDHSPAVDAEGLSIRSHCAGGVRQDSRTQKSVRIHSSRGVGDEAEEKCNAQGVVRGSDSGPEEVLHLPYLKRQTGRHQRNASSQVCTHDSEWTGIQRTAKVKGSSAR